jgi:hypothetical protein
MSNLRPERAEIAHLIHANLDKIARVNDRGTDVRILLQVCAGMLTETCFFFEEPDETLRASIVKLSVLLGCDPYEGELPSYVDFEPQQIDRYTERGRDLARMAITDWADCEFAYHDMMTNLFHHVLTSWEDEGIPRAESFRLLVEFTTNCMAFEIAAQELCDVLIEKKIARDGWTIGDCIGGLAGAAGWRLAKHKLLQQKLPKHEVPQTPDDLDILVSVMTAEAVRMGVPAGSDWRFGLAANDCPYNPPTTLLAGVESYCTLFFSSLPMPCQRQQAVACAKAAGRMLAVASTGDDPEIAPVIAKPLAMAAITETYKSFWLGY